MPRTKKNADAVTAEITEVTATEETTTKTKKSKAGKGDAKVPYVENYHVKMWFVQPLLGSAPSDPDLYKRFIASNAPDAPTREEELLTNTVEDVAAKGVNVFLRRTATGKPCVGQHTIKGYFKESMTASRRQAGSVSEKISGHKTKITGNIVISPTFINLQLPAEYVKTMTDEEFKKDGFGGAAVVQIPTEGSRFTKHLFQTLDRPLQADTAKGKITSIASSEMAPAGTAIEYDMKIEMKDLSSSIIDIIKRGIDHGTGQWRGSGEYGAFIAEVWDQDGNYVDGNTKEVIGSMSTDDDFQEKLWEYIEDTNL